MSPSIVNQTIAVTGSMSANKEICALTGLALSSFVEGVLATLETVSNCVAESECMANITKICDVEQTVNTPTGEGRHLALNSDQSSKLADYQIYFEFIFMYTCEYSTCASTADMATTESFVNTVKKKIGSSFNNDVFLALLTTELSTTTLADPYSLSEVFNNITVCLEVYGMIDYLPTLDVPPPPGSEAPLTGVFYPDWDGQTGTCLQDGNQPDYMTDSPDLWLYSSLGECCERYYSGWNLNACLNTDIGSGLWYADHMSGKCVTDCDFGYGERCGGLANLIAEDLYATPMECCKNNFAWIKPKFCESKSLGINCYVGSSKFYRGDESGAEVCVRDCDPYISGESSCGGIVKEVYIELHDTVEECCSQEYNYIDSELCVSKSTKRAISKFWPDMINGRCLDESVEPTADLSVKLYDTIEDCCTAEILWLTKSECAVASNSTAAASQGTGKYYIQWYDESCVKDCIGDSPCGGLASYWNNLYETAKECCARLPWVDGNECITNAELGS